jgi:alcohol-forming fatty acyl-CoA reductase
MALAPQDKQIFVDELNIIINCAGSVEFNARLDYAINLNVTSPL